LDLQETLVIIGKYLIIRVTTGTKGIPYIQLAAESARLEKWLFTGWAVGGEK